MTSKCGMMLNRWKEILLTTNYWHKQCWTKHPEKFDFMDNLTKQYFLKCNNCFQIIFVLLLHRRTFKVLFILPQYNSQYSFNIVHTVINIMLMRQNLDTIYLEYEKQCFHQQTIKPSKMISNCLQNDRLNQIIRFLIPNCWLTSHYINQCWARCLTQCTTVVGDKMSAACAA